MRRPTGSRLPPPSGRGGRLVRQEHSPFAITRCATRVRRVACASRSPIAPPLTELGTRHSAFGGAAAAAALAPANRCEFQKARNTPAAIGRIANDNVRTLPPRYTRLDLIPPPQSDAAATAVAGTAAAAATTTITTTTTTPTTAPRLELGPSWSVARAPRARTHAHSRNTLRYVRAN